MCVPSTASSDPPIQPPLTQHASTAADEGLSRLNKEMARRWWPVQGRTARSQVLTCLGHHGQQHAATRTAGKADTLVLADSTHTAKMHAGRKKKRFFSGQSESIVSSERMKKNDKKEINIVAHPRVQEDSRGHQILNLVYDSQAAALPRISTGLLACVSSIERVKNPSSRAVTLLWAYRKQAGR